MLKSGYYSDKKLEAALLISVIVTSVLVGGLISQIQLNGVQALYLGIISSFFIMLIIPILVDIVHNRLDLFELRNMFLLFFGFYTLSPLLSIYLSSYGNTSIGFIVHVFSERVDSVTTFAATLCTVSLLTFYLGYYAPFGPSIAEKFSVSTNKFSMQKATLALVIIVVVALVLFSLLMRSAGGISTYLSAGYRAHVLIAGQTLYAMSFQWLAISILILYFLGDMSNNKRWCFVAIALLLGYILLNAYVGKRGTSVRVLTALLAYIHYARRRLRSREIAVLVVGVILYYGFVAYLRGYDPAEYELAISEMISGLSPVAVVLRAVTGGEQAPFEAFLTMIRAVPDRIPLQWGATYLKIFPSLIPRILWPSRPIDVAHWYLISFFPQTRATLTGYGFFFLAEHYLNFGFLGPMIATFIMGVLFRAINSFRLRALSDKRVILLYAILVGYMPNFIRSEFIGIKSLIFEYIGPALWVIAFGSGWIGIRGHYERAGRLDREHVARS